MIYRWCLLDHLYIFWDRRDSIFPYKTSKYICYVILFRVPAPRPRGISDIMPKLQNVAQSSQFLVKFVLPRGDCRKFLRQKGVNDRFISDNIGLGFDSVLLFWTPSTCPESSEDSQEISGEVLGNFRVNPREDSEGFQETSGEFYGTLGAFPGKF